MRSEILFLGRKAEWACRFTSAAVAVLLYGILTPAGVFLRLSGRDPLGLKRREDHASYWIAHRDRACEPVRKAFGANSTAPGVLSTLRELKKRWMAPLFYTSIAFGALTSRRAEPERQDFIYTLF